ncbi:cytidine deaminase [soil metagenome]
MAKTKEISKQTDLVKLKIPSDVEKAWRTAIETRKNAYAPYSKFQVGAAIIDDRGRTFSGCNVENASYGGTICAERNAMLHAVAEGATSARDVIVVTKMNPPAVPCAMCLQVLSEFATPKTRVWLADLEGIKDSVLISELLPRHFGPKSLARGLKK